MRKRWIFIWVTVLIVLVGGLKVAALDIGFSLQTNPVDWEKKNKVYENMDISFISEESAQSAICCFSVNSDGYFALGFEVHDEKTVYVFDPEGAFQYGYSMRGSGAFGSLWIGDHLGVYFTRSDLLLILSDSGVPLDLYKVKSDQQAQEFIRQVLYGTQITVSDSIYSLERDLGIGENNYSRLVVKTPDGMEHVLYDISDAHNTRMIMAAIFSVIGVFGVCFFLHGNGAFRIERKNG